MNTIPENGIVQMASGSPFGSGYKPSEKSPTQIPPSSSLTDVLELAAKMYHWNIPIDYEDDATEYAESDHLQKINHILSATEIQSFVNACAVFESVEGFGSKTGLILSRLIKNAHQESGLDHIELDVRNIKPISLFGYDLKRADERQLEIILRGTLNGWNFHHADCHAIIERLSGTLSPDDYEGEYSIWHDNINTLPGSAHYSQEEAIVSSYISPYGFSRYIMQSSSDPSEFESVFLSVNGNYPDRLMDYFKLYENKIIVVEDFEDIWRPAEAYFATMQKIFGGSS